VVKEVMFVEGEEELDMGKGGVSSRESRELVVENQERRRSV